jgi:hypothetical protein
MKNTPIVINNRDRLTSTKSLVESLHIRGYTNIVILDNGSTYEPLFRWYRSQTFAHVFYNDVTAQTNMALDNLFHHTQHEYFVQLLKDNWYVYTDSDLTLHTYVPYNFVEDLINVCVKYNMHKVGLGIKVDDMVEELYTNKEYWEFMKFMSEYESQFCHQNRLIPENGDICELYRSPIDTTFAVYRPNVKIHSNNGTWENPESLRTGYPYLCKHEPFYYDLANYPADEHHYLSHIPGNVITGFSSKVLRFIK